MKLGAGVSSEMKHWLFHSTNLYIKLRKMAEAKSVKVECDECASQSARTRFSLRKLRQRSKRKHEHDP